MEPRVTSLLMVAPFAAAAWRLRWLTADGAVAAWIVGSMILGFGGVWAIAALLAFFATGTAFTFIGRHKKSQPEHRGPGRDAAQVICTGGVAAATIMLARTAGADPVSQPMWCAAFLGSLAVATADTWAAEIGMLRSAAPRLITTWKPVAAGTSGGVSLVGTIAGGLGAAVIAAFAPLVAPGIGIVGIIVAGIAGMVFDSVLGATLQASFLLPDGTLTETPMREAKLTKGLPWMTNSVVNLTATAFGALTAAVLQRLL